MERLSKIFAINSLILVALVPISLFIVYMNKTGSTEQNIMLVASAFFYLFFAEIPAIICSIGGIVFSVLTRRENFYVSKLPFFISTICFLISGFWSFMILKNFLK